ncbi:MAG: enoyl-CoA hydratase/isomerase family protein [Calditerrivibrio sp.]|nr:enoyl-CoA hydratase/isomerase family protein [Calditerrivibrio sp.]MCA1980866.1 enoyl-CoA hydratase/isomerase family protein [Calditerrivibrio sp.]
MAVDFHFDEYLSTLSIILDGKYLNRQTVKDILSRLKNELKNKKTNFIMLESKGEDFSLGHDIKELSSLDTTEAKVYAFLGQELIKTIKDSKKIFFSKINGKVYGPALEIVLATDLIFATENTSLAFPETEYGFPPAFGGTSLASRKIHENFVKFMTITSEDVDVSEFFCRGIVAKIFKNKIEMEEYVKNIIQKLNQKSLFAIGLAKETINNGIEMDIDKALLLEQNAFSVAFSSYDKKEGMTAFIEKRKPEFKNRWEDYEEIFEI